MLWYPGTGLGIPGIEYGDGGVLEFGAEVPDCCVCTIPYSMPGMPKPVPGYQSIKLSNFKESGVNVGMQSPRGGVDLFIAPDGEGDF
jgi:hypothetical protein